MNSDSVVDQSDLVLFEDALDNAPPIIPVPVLSPLATAVMALSLLLCTARRCGLERDG